MGTLDATGREAMAAVGVAVDAAADAEGLLDCGTAGLFGTTHGGSGASAAELGTALGVGAISDAEGAGAASDADGAGAATSFVAALASTRAFLCFLGGVVGALGPAATSSSSSKLSLGIAPQPE